MVKMSYRVAHGGKGIVLDWKLIRSGLLKTRDLTFLAKLNDLADADANVHADSKAALLARLGWRSKRTDPINRLIQLGFIKICGSRAGHEEAASSVVAGRTPGTTAPQRKWDRLFMEYWWPLWLDRTKQSAKKQYARQCWGRMIPKKETMKNFLARVSRITVEQTNGILDRELKYRGHASSFLNGEDWSEQAEKESL